MPFANINGARLWYEVMGEGEPVFLHHGYTASRENWLPVAQRLRDRYQVIVMECRGVGESEDTADGHSLHQYKNDVLGMADFLGLQRFTYAGHSMGGGIGYLLATDHAERLNKLILMAPIPSGGIPGNPDFARVDEILSMRATDGEARFRAEQIAQRFRLDAETDEWVETRVRQRLRASDEHVRGGLQSMYDLNVSDKLATMTVPTLMLAGSVDELLRANLADFERLPNAILHVFSRAGHDVAIHEPAGVSDAIDQFLIHGVITSADLNKPSRFPTPNQTPHD
ncbi:MAG: alpha/beta hydrolase [Pseudomonadaceae bacterium]|nr:alpha/beta hydrolase [Pseudomonadaceae bacterium]